MHHLHRRILQQETIKPCTFPKLTRPGVIFPLSYNLQRRQPTRIIAWIFPNMWTSFCWVSWKAANGAPNCFLSFKYLWKKKPQLLKLKTGSKLKAHSEIGATYFSKGNPKFHFQIEIKWLLSTDYYNQNLLDFLVLFHFSTPSWLAIVWHWRLNGFCLLTTTIKFTWFLGPFPFFHPSWLAIVWHWGLSIGHKVSP